MLNSLWVNSKRICTLIYNISRKSCLGWYKLTLNLKKLSTYSGSNPIVFDHFRNVYHVNTTLLAYTLFNTTELDTEKGTNGQSADTIEKYTDCYLSSKSTESLMELLHTINFCIIETSQHYKECLNRQINITNESNMTDQHWDELIRFRVEAEELKLEFDKYKLLIHKLERYILSYAVNTLTKDNRISLDDLNQELNTLVSFLNNLEKENKDLEMKLLTAQRNSVVYGSDGV